MSFVLLLPWLVCKPLSKKKKQMNYFIGQPEKNIYIYAYIICTYIYVSYVLIWRYINWKNEIQEVECFMNIVNSSSLSGTFWTSTKYFCKLVILSLRYKFSIIFHFILKHFFFYIFSLGREKSKARRGCREKTEGGKSRNKILPT